MQATSFDVIAALFARDVDEALIRRSLALSPTERLTKLVEMQALGDAAREARSRAAPSTPSDPG